MTDEEILAKTSEDAKKLSSAVILLLSVLCFIPAMLNFMGRLGEIYMNEWDRRRAEDKPTENGNA